MAILQIILNNLLAFVAVISIIVFIHEFGHFIVARWCGVRVEQFSIGFGKKLFSFTDSKKTIWKFCLLPLGGYVKMYGDANSASVPDYELIKKMSSSDKKISFIAKNVYQRMAIVFAGPLANILLALVIFTILFRVYGITKVSPTISEILPDGPAFGAGLKINDKIIKVAGQGIDDFSEIKRILAFHTKNKIEVIVLRNEKELIFELEPKEIQSKDMFGEDIKTKIIGISASDIYTKKLNLWQSFVNANLECYDIATGILKALGQIITGHIPLKEMGGPIKIAKYSSKSFEMGLRVVLWFSALISLNLAVMNLLPIPVLDGGHLFYYVLEAIFGKPIPAKIQMIGYKIGMAIVLSLMIFTVCNDIFQVSANFFNKN